jgi:hypothetical protein
MKTHRCAIRWVVVAVAIGLIAGWIASAQEKPRYEKRGIIIPGTALSKDDEKAMNKILKQYDKSLYRIDVYEKGERKKTLGTLSEVVIGRKLMSQVAENARKTGFTHYAIRIGATEGVGHNTPTPGVTEGTGHNPTPAQGATIGGTGHATPTPVESMSYGGTGHATPTPGTAVFGEKAHDRTDSDELVERLKPIFEKYKKE